MQICFLMPMILGALFLFVGVRTVVPPVSVGPDVTPTPVVSNIEDAGNTAISLSDAGVVHLTATQLLANKRFNCSLKESWQQCTENVATDTGITS